MPKTLDVLAPGAEYISDMTQQIQASLNLLILLKQRYGGHLLFVKLQLSLTKKDGLFEHLLLAFQTAQDALDQQIADYTKKQPDDLEN